MFSEGQLKQKIEKIISNLNGLKEPKSETNMFKALADFVVDYAVLELKKLLIELGKGGEQQCKKH